MTFPINFKIFFVLGLGHQNIKNVVGEINFFYKKELNKLYKNSNTLLLFVDIIFYFLYFTNVIFVVNVIKYYY